jgi:hypothetical protein
VASLLHPLHQRLDVVSALHEGQQLVASKQDLLLSSQSGVSSQLFAPPACFSDAVSALAALQAELRSRFEEPTSNTHEMLRHVSSLLKDVAKSQKKLSQNSEEPSLLQRGLLKRLKTLPEDLASLTTASRTVHAEPLHWPDALKGEQLQAYRREAGS